MNALHVLVLCAGNVGRSPLGEVMLGAALASALGVSADELARRGVVISSAGTHAPDGHRASSRGIVFAHQHGMDLSAHEARLLTAEMIEQADLVLCMDNQQVLAVRDLVPGAGEKTRLFADGGVEVPDPHHHDDAFFNDVAHQISLAVDRLIPALLEQIGGSGGSDVVHSRMS